MLKEHAVTEEETRKATALTLWRVQDNAVRREREVFFAENGFRILVPTDEDGTFAALFGNQCPDTLALIDVSTLTEVSRFSFDDVSDILSMQIISAHLIGDYSPKKKPSVEE